MKQFLLGLFAVCCFPMIAIAYSPKTSDVALVNQLKLVIEQRVEENREGMAALHQQL